MLISNNLHSSSMNLEEYTTEQYAWWHVQLEYEYTSLGWIYIDLYLEGAT